MKKKLTALAVGIGILALLAVLASLESRGRSAPREAPNGFEIGIPTAQEVRSLVQGYGLRVQETEAELEAVRKELTTVRSRLEEAAQSRDSILEALRSQFQKPESPPERNAMPRFRKFEFEDSQDDEASIHIPAGSFGEATLLTGVYAPVNDEPLPVLIRLDTVLIGPTRSRVPIQDAFLVGKATGDANSERAVIQLQALSYVAPSGRTFEVPVNGWVIDEDGVQGVQGRYVWRADEIAALAVVTGALAGGADALSLKETTSFTSSVGTTTAVSGNPLKFAGSRAASSALRKIGEIVGQRMEEIVPAVHVANARRITVAFISGVTLTGLRETEHENHRPYSGLDLDR